MKRPAVAVLLVLALALLVGGCGGGSNGGSNSTAPEGGAGKKATAPNAPAGSKVVACGDRLRATAVDCATARTVMQRWQSSRSCALGSGSRSSCSLGGLRCQAVKVDKGASVSCAGPEGDVSFVVKPAG